MQFKSLSRTISEQTKEFKMILLWEKFFVCFEIATFCWIWYTATTIIVKKTF